MTCKTAWDPDVGFDGLELRLATGDHIPLQCEAPQPFSGASRGPLKHFSEDSLVHYCMFGDLPVFGIGACEGEMILIYKLKYTDLSLDTVRVTGIGAEIDDVHVIQRERPKCSSADDIDREALHDVLGERARSSNQEKGPKKSKQTGCYTKNGGFDFLSMGSLLDTSGDCQTKRQGHRESNHAPTGPPNVPGGTPNQSLPSLQNELCSVLGIDPNKLPGSGQTSAKGNQVEDMDLQTILDEAGLQEIGTIQELLHATHQSVDETLEGEGEDDNFDGFLPGGDDCEATIVIEDNDSNKPEEFEMKLIDSSDLHGSMEALIACPSSKASSSSSSDVKKKAVPEETGTTSFHKVDDNDLGELGYITFQEYQGRRVSVKATCRQHKRVGSCTCWARAPGQLDDAATAVRNWLSEGSSCSKEVHANSSISIRQRFGMKVRAKGVDV